MVPLQFRYTEYRILSFIFLLASNLNRVKKQKSNEYYYTEKEYKTT